MNALVTGGTGFIGRHLVDCLHRRGDTVTALVRSERRAEHLARSGVKLVLGDLHNARALESACSDQEVVYHVAGLIAARNEAEFLQANRDGTQHLLAAALECRVRRFILVSSLAAAGPTRPGHPLDGSEEPRPVTAYGRSKLAAEEAVKAARVDWTIVRPPVVYGPWDLELLRLFKVARLGLAPVFGSGDQELSAVFGPDLAEALSAVANSDHTTAQTYYACHPQRFTSGDLIQSIGASLGRPVRTLRLPQGLARPLLGLSGTLAALTGRRTVLNSDKANEFFQPAWTADPSTLTAETGWQASHDLAAGLTATVEWYRNAGWL